MTLKERISGGDRFARSIGVELTEVREGYARAELTVREDHLNAAGACQGGVYYTLADLAFAAVANPSRSTITSSPTARSRSATRRARSWPA